MAIRDGEGEDGGADTPRELGVLEGEGWIADDFDEPLPEEFLITPPGEPHRELTPTEIATERALLETLAQIAWDPEPFDAVELVRESRR